MADGPDLSELLRRTVQANARFYQGWVNLSLEYLRGISEIFGVQGAPPPGPDVVESTDAGTGVLVLESEAGTAATGAFLVTNDLGRNMTCELVATNFADVAGERVAAQPRFDPPRVELAPGEQRVVQVTVPIDAKLTPGVAYSGQFSIKGMEGFAIPVVLRRRHQVDESPIDREVKVEETKPRKAQSGKAARPKPTAKQPGKQAPQPAARRRKR